MKSPSTAEYLAPELMESEISHWAELARNPIVAREFEREGFFGLGQSYINGLWDTPELDQTLFELINSNHSASSPILKLRLLVHLLTDRIFNPQKGQRAYHIGKAHYGLGNDLFTRMLGKSMSYTCGYWPNASSLDQAQEAKLELTCQKLHLKPGMKVLDIGCGWGNFAYYAARRYGVSVTGLTVSEEQARFARDFCQGLPVEILLEDYRHANGSFDRVVSIEMIEAVGRKNLQTFFAIAHRVLKPNGLFLLEAISCESISPLASAYIEQYLIWIVRHIFPDGYLPKISELARPARDLFVMEDLHNFGRDYDHTLMEWAKNFNTNWDELSQKYDQTFRRTWNFYLYGCAAFFRARLIQLYQVVYSKGGEPDGYQPVR